MTFCSTALGMTCLIFCCLCISWLRDFNALASEQMIWSVTKGEWDEVKEGNTLLKQFPIFQMNFPVMDNWLEALKKWAYRNVGQELANDLQEYWTHSFNLHSALRGGENRKRKKNHKQCTHWVFGREKPCIFLVFLKLIKKCWCSSKNFCVVLNFTLEVTTLLLLLSLYFMSIFGHLRTSKNLQQHLRKPSPSLWQNWPGETF